MTVTRRLIAALAAITTMAAPAALSPTAHAGSLVRVWNQAVDIDVNMPGRYAPAVTAAHGSAAAAAWISGGHAWLSERSAATETWGAKVDLGASDGSGLDVAYGADGTLAVVFSVGETLGSTPRLLTRAPGAVGFTSRQLALSEVESAPVATIRLVVSDAPTATVAWVRPGPTGGIRLAVPGGRALNLLGSEIPGPITRLELLAHGTKPPTLVWLGDVSKSGARVHLLQRGTAVTAWPAYSTASLVSPAAASAKDMSASGGDDGTTVVVYRAADTDPLPGLFTSTGTAAGVFTTPVHVAGTDAFTSGGMVAAGPGGAATLAWRKIVPANPTKVYVVDRAAASVAWPTPHELTLVCPSACADDPVSDPAVARGADGTGLVMWNGYGATNGMTTAFAGRGSTWEEKGIVSDDNGAAGRPLVLGDGTTVVVGSGVTFTGGPEIDWLQVREGRLFMTGPAPSGPATLTGTARVGGTLTCWSPSWAPVPATKAYAWLRNGAVISGAASASYRPVAADLGKAVQCRITATTTGVFAGSTSVLSNAVTVALGLAPTAAAGSVAVLGTHKVGVVQTCRLGTWAPTATYAHTVRWLRDGVVISGATASTYTPPATMRGHKLACRVTSARAGYATGTATSAAVLIA